MHTVELYEAALRVAKSLGYRVREECLGGAGGGVCEFGGTKCLFIDLELSPLERLDLVTTALEADPQINSVGVPLEVANQFPGRRIGRAA